MEIFTEPFFWGMFITGLLGVLVGYRAGKSTVEKDKENSR